MIGSHRISLPKNLQEHQLKFQYISRS